ncbi:MAG: hypothetical protein K2O73_05655, partial [Lachnospiraceae bacterium]|nr:hypothetical protein [Lachnospiraceae bacterium]
HRVFALNGKPQNVKVHEAALNELLELQGQLNNDVKDLKKTKAKLMENIVQNMEGTHEENINDISSRKLEEDRRLIDEINDRIEASEDELMELPRKIQETNRILMISTMQFCYQKLRDNVSEIDEITEWITQVRIDLKKNIIKKQNREINNRQIYSYMHDIFGAQILDLFDLKEEDEERLQGKKEN